MTNDKILSASRMKTFESCSWLYYCKYHLKIPDISNDGAKKGTICHLVFEVLLPSKRKAIAKKIVSNGSVTAAPSVHRLIHKHMKKLELSDTPDNFDDIDQMINVGLRNNFYCKGADIFKPETEFNISSEDPKYKMRGFIDKVAKYKGNKIKIFDYKSSKKKFVGEDLEINTQAMMYSLWAKKQDPDYEPEVSFVFLKFPRSPFCELKYSDAALAGFEYYMAAMYDKINNFKERDAYRHFAKNDDFPSNGEFKGPLLCNIHAKTKGQKKKDGSVMWHCPMKFDLDYFVILDEDDEVIASAFKKEDLSPKDGQRIEERHYEGCPAYNQPDRFKNL